MIPTREQAEELLREAETCNPGPWGNHSRVAAHCAERIAARIPAMDSEKAYVLGLLHDIGRKFGKRHMGHVADGYSYMKKLGYDEVARVCLSHSFNTKSTKLYIGNFDTTEEELRMIEETLAAMTYDEYDRLIILCDALSGAEGVTSMEERMLDVKRRYGFFPQEKWDCYFSMFHHFEDLMGVDLYTEVKKNKRMFKTL